MRLYLYPCLLLLACLFTSCGIEAGENDPTDPGEPDTVAYRDVSSSSLPLNNLSGTSNDAKAVDIDGDDDLDLIIAIEFGPNKLLINDGSGSFSDESRLRMPARNFNSEGVAVARFDTDRLFDIFFANEANRDNQTNEFYLGQSGTSFVDATGLIPVTGASKTVKTADVDSDGDIDILIGNIGQNILLINNGNARFFNETGNRLPRRLDLTQDIAFADIDGDSDMDIVVANEDDNRILINTGAGFYQDQTSSRLPLIGGIEETYGIDLGDVDGDGDLDLYFSNVQIFESGSNPQDRLLINDGKGVFGDSTSSHLPEKITDTVDADFFDIDGDDDLDILVGNFDGGAQVFINNGSGIFADSTDSWLPENFSPRVIDFETADYNGDGLPDIYVANFQSADALLIRKRE